MASKLAGLKFVKGDKGVEFEISFVSYQRSSGDLKKKSTKKTSKDA